MSPDRDHLDRRIAERTVGFAAQRKRDQEALASTIRQGEIAQRQAAELRRQAEARALKELGPHIDRINIQIHDHELDKLLRKLFDRYGGNRQWVTKRNIWTGAIKHVEQHLPLQIERIPSKLIRPDAMYQYESCPQSSDRTFTIDPGYIRIYLAGIEHGFQFLGRDIVQVYAGNYEGKLPFNELKSRLVDAVAKYDAGASGGIGSDMGLTYHEPPQSDLSYSD